MKKKIFIAIGVILALAIAALFCLTWYYGLSQPGPDTEYVPDRSRPAGQPDRLCRRDGSRARQPDGRYCLADQREGRRGTASRKASRSRPMRCLAELAQTSLSQNIIRRRPTWSAPRMTLDKVMNNSEARAERAPGADPGPAGPG